MVADANDLNQAKWMRAYADIVLEVDQESSKKERAFIRTQRNKWLHRYHKMNSLYADSLKDFDQASTVDDLKALGNSSSKVDIEKISNPFEYVKASLLVGETAVLMEVEEALSTGKQDRVQELYIKYGPHITNKDNKVAMLQALVVMYQEKGEYGRALGALNQIEGLEPDEEMVMGWQPMEMSLIKSELEESAKKNRQKVVFEKALPGKVHATEELPTEFKLSNAYPNPFNPATVIPFTLPQYGKVRIEVYTITGSLVSVLTNQNYEAGNHKATFDASNLASGIYLVRANLAGTIQSQKVTLIK